MQKRRNILCINPKKIILLPLVAVFMLSTSGFAQDKKGTTNVKKTEAHNTERVELNYKQRHSRTNSTNNLYADGIKIKRDLSILKEIQEERILSEDEIPAEDIYGGIWNNRYVNAYRSIENIPDTFKVDLSNFTMPTMGYTTSNFGPRRRRMHYGIDLKVQVGDTIYAAFDGKVRLKQYERKGYGYYLALRHSNGLETVYGHLSKFLVSEDDVVRSGDPIALGGNTGRSTGSHLHFEFRFLGRPIDPTLIVDFDNKVCHRDTYTVTPRTFTYSTRNLKGVNVNSLAAGTVTNTRSNASVKNKYASGDFKYHRIKQGDTLGAIAAKYGTTVKKLCALNNISTKTRLRVGKTLRTT